MKVTLTIENGHERGRKLVFENPGQYTLGRGKEHEPYRLGSDARISRSHFMIEVTTKAAILHDLSSNGTFLGGREERVDNHILATGDVIIAGDTVLRVSLSDFTQIFCHICGSAGPISNGYKGDDKPIFYCSSCRAALSENPVLPTGYELLGKLGRGGLGSVFLARNSQGTERAVKVLLPQHVTDITARQRFLREATILAQLRHPNIVRHIHLCELEFEQRPGIFAIVMEYFPGRGADLVLKELGAPGLPRRLAVTIVDQVLAGLAYAHAQGVVHRDVKPGNILVLLENTMRGIPEQAQVKLCDFGLAKQYISAEDSFVTVSPTPIGTIFYMAPEQIRDFVNTKPPSDIYAAGAVLYRLLTGRYTHDFPSDPVSIEHYDQVLQRGRMVPIQKRDSSIPPALASVVMKALAYDINERFPTAEAMRRALQDAFPA